MMFCDLFKNYQQRYYDQNIFQILWYACEIAQQFRMEKSEARCLSLHTINTIRDLIDEYPYKNVSDQGEYDILVQTLIRPVEKELYKWKQQVCYNCEKDFNQTFILTFCLEKIERITKDQIDHRIRIAQLQQIMRSFEFQLNMFQGIMNCSELGKN